MARLTSVAALFVGLLVLGVAAHADMPGDAKAKSPAGACGQKRTCPLKAALDQVALTPDQQAKLTALQAACKAEMQKAKACGCPKKAASVRRSARETLKAGLLSILTPEQKTVGEPALAKMGSSHKKAGSCPK